MVIVDAPAQSSGALLPWSFGIYRHAIAIAARPNGRLRRKIVRHPATSISQPPSGGPIAFAMAPVAAHVPIARPLAAPLKLLPRMPRLFGISIASPDALQCARSEQDLYLRRESTGQRGEKKDRNSRDQ